MAFDFMKGRQMIIHDPRLNNPGHWEGRIRRLVPRPRPLEPPDAMNKWTVKLTDSAEQIISWAATVAAGDSGVKQLDGLHFMAHGYVGGMELGKDGLGWKNVDLFKKLNGLIRGAIVFYSCQVGGEQQYHGLSFPLTFGNAVARFADCEVVTCKVNQLYSWNPAGVIDFGEFEDVVYVHHPDPDRGTEIRNVQGAKLDLESIVFPKTARLRKAGLAGKSAGKRSTP
jgi:hypothetical protein